jgi:hypothetical protein
MRKYQQGDVLFIKQDDANTDKGWNVTTEKKYGSNEIVNCMKPGDKMGGYHSTEHETAYVNGKAEGKKLTVAHGEVTGHSHSFYMDKNPPGVEITAFGRTRTRVGEVPRFIDVQGSATVNHEEHNALTMPTGLYEVKIVKEFDHIAGISRNVMD